MLRNILITGSGGFVGKNIKEYLDNRYNLICPRSFELDLTDTDKVMTFFAEHKIDAVIHCASVGGVRGCNDPESCEKDNLKMVENLLKYKNDNANVILFGSGAAYSKNRNLHKVKESRIGEVIPEDLYGKSKMEIAKFCKSRRDTLCLNIFACYGKYENDSRFPTYAVMQNLKHEPVVINQNVVFDYLYINDLCKIVEFFMNNFPSDNRVINVTPTESVSLFEIAQTVNKISGYDAKISFLKDGLNYEYTGDNALLLKEIPDFKFTPIEQGLKELFEICKKILNNT